MYSNAEINVVQLAKGVAERLRTLSYYIECDPDFMDIIKEFNAIDVYSGLQDYEIALDYLFDFGDRGCRLWVETDLPTSKSDIADDKRATTLAAVKMFKDYEDHTEIPSVITTPKYDQSISRAQPSTTTTPKSCSTPYRAPKYKPIRFLTSYEFDKRLKGKGIEPNTLNTDISNYVRDADDDYQNFLMDVIAKNGGKLMVPKKAPLPRKKAEDNVEAR
jgi:hypothetical protein